MSELSVVLRKRPGTKPLLASTNALKVLWKLEDAGCEVSAKAGPLTVTPPEGKPSLTKAQSDMLSAHRRQIRSIVQYVERMK